MVNPLKEPVWLKDHLNDPDLVVVDCRYDLFDPEYGRRSYMKDHIKGAYFMDLLNDMTGRISRNGGRHPLPDVEDFARKLENMGISEKSTVVAYDDNWSGAARFYFLMDYIGFRNSYVLNGLYSSWKGHNYPISAEVPENKKGSVRLNLNHRIRLEVNQVRERFGGIKLVDSRSSDRFRGENETIDPVAGHIPGAVNHPFTESVNNQGYLNSKQLAEKFRNLPEDPVLYCGSGVTACVNFVAMRTAGKDPRVYCGSWSDWISYPENPVER